MNELFSGAEAKSNLKRRFLESIERINRELNAPHGPNTVDQLVRRFGATSIRASFGLIDTSRLRPHVGLEPPHFDKALAGSEAMRRELDQLSANYKLLHSRYSRLKDERRAEERADLIDRFRLLLFRLITAIGIATVVLGTGFVANKFGIPLPLLHL